MEKFKRFVRKRLPLIVLFFIINIAFCIAIAYTESWLWISAEIVGYLFIAYIVIAIDTAIEYPDEFKNIKR